MDEKVLLMVVHRVTEVHGLDAPTVPFKLLDHVIVEVLVVDRIVRAEGGCIVIIDHGLVAMLRIVAAEVLDESRNLTLELDLERFYDIQLLWRYLCVGTISKYEIGGADKIVAVYFGYSCPESNIQIVKKCSLMERFNFIK